MNKLQNIIRNKKFKKIFIISLISFILLAILSLIILVYYIFPMTIVKPIKPIIIVSADTKLKENNIKFDILQCVTKDSIKLDMRYVYAKNQISNKVVIILHGISANKEQSVEKAIDLAENGYNSVIFDLRGHGKSGGDYCTYGYKEKYDIVSIIDLIKEKYGSEMKFCVWGPSLGGAIALQAMEIDKRIICGIIESTFADLREIIFDYARNMYNIRNTYLIEHSLRKAESIAGFFADSVKPENSARNIFAPVMLIHGDNDNRISIHYSERIFNKLGSTNKEFYVVRNAGHLNVREIGGKEYSNRILNFLKRNFN